MKVGHATDYVILVITLEGEGRTLVKLIKISKLSIQSVASPSTMAEGPSEEENPLTAAGTAPPKRYSNSLDTYIVNWLIILREQNLTKAPLL